MNHPAAGRQKGASTTGTTHKDEDGDLLHHGASSGLGAALARAVLDHGDNAAITARNTGHVQGLAGAYPDSALALRLDVTDHGQVVAAVSAATERFGAVDVLVNNAGHGFRAAVEEAAADEVGELFATNFFGPVDLIKQVLPQMRARRSGIIVNVSSIGAPRSNPGSGYYTATKAALEGMSDALNREVGPLGIRVMVIEPGGAGRGRLRFAFYGRVSTEDWQDPVTSRARQLQQAMMLVAGRGVIAVEFFDTAQSRALPWARRPQAAALVAQLMTASVIIHGAP